MFVRRIIDNGYFVIDPLHLLVSEQTRECTHAIDVARFGGCRRKTGKPYEYENAVSHAWISDIYWIFLKIFLKSARLSLACASEDDSRAVVAAADFALELREFFADDFFRPQERSLEREGVDDGDSAFRFAVFPLHIHPRRGDRAREIALADRRDAVHVNLAR